MHPTKFPAGYLSRIELSTAEDWYGSYDDRMGHTKNEKFEKRN
jgi:hypothetical protein